MERVIPVLVLIALIAGWNFFLYRSSRGRMWSPLWMAFSASAGACLYLVAGLAGYTLSRHDRFVAGTPWSTGVIWSEIWIGLALSLLAVYLWRRGLHSIRRA